MAFSTSRTQDNSFQSTSRANQDLDKIIAGDITCDSLAISGNVTLGDDDHIQFGAGNDMTIGHDPEINYITHSKQIQFLSSMTTGDSIKWRETERRNIIFTFASASESGSQRSNCYLDAGNETYDSTANVPYIKLRIRSQDNVSSIVNAIEIFQPGQGTADAETRINTDLYIPDGRSAFWGDSNDFQIIHTGSATFIDEQGGGELHIRTNGNFVAFSDTTSSANYMAKLIKDGAVELYHNKVKKLETTSTGISVSGSVEFTSPLVALADGWDSADSITSAYFLSGMMIRATFLVDLGAESYSSAENSVIGATNYDPNYITQLTTASVGLVYKIEFICVEAPAGGITNIDVSVSASSLTRNGTTGIEKIVDGGAHSPNMTFNSATGSALGANLTDKYLYLTAGSGGNTNQFTAGKFLIILEGLKI